LWSKLEEEKVPEAEIQSEVIANFMAKHPIKGVIVRNGKVMDVKAAGFRPPQLVVLRRVGTPLVRDAHPGFAKVAGASIWN